MSHQADFEELKDRTEAYIQENEGASFVEIENLLKDEIPVEGDMWISGDPSSNVYTWMGVSEEFVQVVSELTEEDRIHPYPCEPFVYMVDGKSPDLEIAKQPPEGGYASERWLPVAYYSYDKYEETGV